eukprot:TRINITY_DN4575_c0_g1_i3.p1 TRINITY_DN4575_c0_g1~~TRINITY_DN4575_c0_g1_i3.p1  ORF type:complete len:191 (+),score=37.18 TRINITY_DN4575_c0_g1_i3:63-635(+)
MCIRDSNTTEHRLPSVMDDVNDDDYYTLEAFISSKTPLRPALHHKGQDEDEFETYVKNKILLTNLKHHKELFLGEPPVYPAEPLPPYATHGKPGTMRTVGNGNGSLMNTQNLEVRPDLDGSEDLNGNGIQANGTQNSFGQSRVKTWHTSSPMKESKYDVIQSVSPGANVYDFMDEQAFRLQRERQKYDQI